MRCYIVQWPGLGIGKPGIGGYWTRNWPRMVATGIGIGLGKLGYSPAFMPTQRSNVKNISTGL